MKDDLKMNALEQMTIGRLAKTAGVNVETIRFYQRRGLMQVGSNPGGGFRVYSSEDSARLQFIKSAQRIGFTLDEVGELLELDDGTSCARARGLAEDKLADIRQRLADLRQIELRLNRLIQLCGRAKGRVSCPLIEALREESTV